MKRPVVSLCTIVKDAAALLPEMIRSARPVADEIVLVDTGSTDDTFQVARSLGARVGLWPWNDRFDEARNAALELARGEWILVLDADDRLLPAGVTMVRRCIAWGRAKLRELAAAGYLLTIDEQTIDGTSLGLAVSSGRLWPRSGSLRYVGRVHEEIHYLPNPTATKWCHVEGVHVRHIGYDPSLMPAKYARNERLLRLRLEDDPADIWAYYYLATQYEQMGRLDEARGAAERSLDLDDDKRAMAHEHIQAMLAIIRTKEG